MGLTCCHLRIKLLTGEELLLTDAQGKWFLEVESPPCEEAMKMVGMATKDLEYYKNLVDKAAARFERTDFHFQRNSPVAKMLSSSIASSRETVYERKSRSMQQTSLLPHFKKLPHQPQPSVSSHQH